MDYEQSMLSNKELFLSIKLFFRFSVSVVTMSEQKVERKKQNQNGPYGRQKSYNREGNQLICGI